MANCYIIIKTYTIGGNNEKKGLSAEFEVNSKATSDEEIGNDTHPGTKKKLDEMKIPYTKRKAMKVNTDDYHHYDYLICMDKNNLRNLNVIIGNDKKGKVKLLMEFTGACCEIADPWYTGNFDKTFQDVLTGCKSFLNCLEVI